MNSNPPQKRSDLALGCACVLSATICFHLAFPFDAPAFTLPFIVSLIAVTELKTSRRAFYTGLVIGLICYGSGLSFFHTLFGLSAVALWLVLAFWLGLFVVLAQLFKRAFGAWAWCALPFLWLALEYFRSELYYLRFSWLTAGYAFHDSPLLPWIAPAGVYGIGFIVAAAGAAIYCLPTSARKLGIVSATLALMTLEAIAPRPAAQEHAGERVVHLAGIQAEFPAADQIPRILDGVMKSAPDAEVLVLSEYTFDGPVPDEVRQWCATNGKYLIAGGKDPLADERYHNTAFVVGPSEEIEFKQAKSVPIQFFDDGEPAPERRVWDSPWGKIGVMICYDMSYARVVDDFVEQGAGALIVPMMDVAEWGEAQHRLHATISPVRAAEYRLPIFRIASSGISQHVNASGQVVASAGFPGQGEILSGAVAIDSTGRLPMDRHVAPAAMAMTSALWLIAFKIRATQKGRPASRLI